MLGDQLFLHTGSYVYRCASISSSAEWKYLLRPPFSPERVSSRNPNRTEGRVSFLDAADSFEGWSVSKRNKGNGPFFFLLNENPNERRVEGEPNGAHAARNVCSSGRRA